MSMLSKYNLFLSSAQRNIGGSPSNFEINIQPNISLKSANSHFRVYIHSATIPFSWTQWSSINNVTKIRLTQGVKTFDGQFSIPAGNYTILTFMTAWITALEAQLGVLNAYFPNITYTYNPDTNAVNIVLPFDGTGSVITFYNASGYTYVNQALGFTSQWTLTSGSSATSTVQCNINPARVLYIYSTTLASPHNLEALTAQCSTSTQIAAIPITVLPNQYIVFVPFNYLVSQIGNKDLSKINIQIQSEDQPDGVNLQNFNLDWSFVLVLEEWENAETSMSKVDHFIELQEQKQEIEKKALETQREELQKARDEVVQSLVKMKKKVKKSIDNSKDDVQQDS